MKYDLIALFGEVKGLLPKEIHSVWILVSVMRSSIIVLNLTLNRRDYIRFYFIFVIPFVFKHTLKFLKIVVTSRYLTDCSDFFYMHVTPPNFV